jgi:hypothetical protein
MDSKKLVVVVVVVNMMCVNGCQKDTASQPYNLLLASIIPCYKALFRKIQMHFSHQISRGEKAAIRYTTKGSVKIHKKIKIRFLCINGKRGSSTKIPDQEIVLYPKKKKLCCCPAPVVVIATVGCMGGGSVSQPFGAKQPLTSK